MDQVAFNAADCLARVRQGDEIAARDLVEHLYPFVIRIVRNHLPRRGSEEELAQDIFVRMFSRLHQYRGEVAIEHWVSRIAVNHCLNAIRARKVRPEWRMGDLSEEHELVAQATVAATTGDPHPAEAMAARELVDLLLECLLPQDQALIRMLELEDRPVEEIATILGWSVAQTRVRAFRARQKLNRHFERLRKAGKL